MTSLIDNYLKKLDIPNRTLVRRSAVNPFLVLLCLISIASILISIQAVSAARGFQLGVNLWDGKDDSGKVSVYAISHDTDRKKAKSLDVGRLVSKSGDSNIENIIFRFTDKQLPPNGEFSVCVYSKNYHKTQCEQADRHHDIHSAVMWVQVPSP